MSITAQYTVEYLEDLTIHHGLNVEEELTNFLFNEISDEYFGSLSKEEIIIALREKFSDKQFKKQIILRPRKYENGSKTFTLDIIKENFGDMPLEVIVNVLKEKYPENFI